MFVPLLGSEGLKLVLGSPSASMPALVSMQPSKAEQSEELKAALFAITPVFFHLVRLDAITTSNHAIPPST
ncbi:MAG: hypothetical protein SGPRY_008305 [Prymnesium sp.]